MMNDPVTCFFFKWAWCAPVFGAPIHWVFTYLRQTLGEGTRPWSRSTFAIVLTLFDLRFSLPMLMIGFGILSGSLSSSFAFVRISEKNPYVIAFWALTYISESAFFYWYVFANSRETRTLYWRIFGKPLTSPSLEKAVHTLQFLAILVAPFVAEQLPIPKEMLNPCP
jgi:hypothetical protein